MSLITRRGLLRGLFAAPAVVAYGHLMPVRALPPELMEESIYVIAGLNGEVLTQKVRLLRTMNDVARFYCEDMSWVMREQTSLDAGSFGWNIAGVPVDTPQELRDQLARRPCLSAGDSLTISLGEMTLT